MAEKGTIPVGEKAPLFRLLDQNGNEVSMEDFRGKWVILYFYPKDNTPGCTTEALDFTQNIEAFGKLGSVVLGVSPDSAKSHKNFCEKKNLKVTLLADTEREVLQKYGVWQLKKMYGRESMGVVRTTYLINPEGKVSYIWPKVKVNGHVEDVKNKLAELKKGS